MTGIWRGSTSSDLAHRARRYHDFCNAYDIGIPAARCHSRSSAKSPSPPKRTGWSSLDDARFTMPPRAIKTTRGAVTEAKSKGGKSPKSPAVTPRTARANRAKNRAGKREQPPPPEED